MLGSTLVHVSYGLSQMYAQGKGDNLLLPPTLLSFKAFQQLKKFNSWL